MDLVWYANILELYKQTNLKSRTRLNNPEMCQYAAAMHTYVNMVPKEEDVFP